MMTFRHFWHSHDHRWRRRIALSLAVLPMLGPCISKGGSDRMRWDFHWTTDLLRWSQSHEDPHEAETDLVDAVSAG